jgi:hypothetical protein
MKQTYGRVQWWGFHIKGVEPSGLTTREWTSYMAMNYTLQDAYDS